MKKAYTEVLEILRLLPKEEYLKIPKEEIEFFEKNKDIYYNYEYKDFNYSRKAGAILVNLYKKYIANDKENKLIDEILELNSKKIEKSLNQVSDVNFNDKKEEKSVSIVKYKKESFFKRFFYKIKNIFKIK